MTESVVKVSMIDDNNLKSSKYFSKHKKEDNRMVVFDAGERMISEKERELLQDRYDAFMNYVLHNIDTF